VRYSIVRATQFFELIPRLDEGGAERGDTIHLSPVASCRPIAGWGPTRLGACRRRRQTGSPTGGHSPKGWDVSGGPCGSTIWSRRVASRSDQPSIGGGGRPSDSRITSCVNSRGHGQRRSRQGKRSGDHRPGASRPTTFESGLRRDGSEGRTQTWTDDGGRVLRAHRSTIRFMPEQPRSAGGRYIETR